MTSYAKHSAIVLGLVPGICIGPVLLTCIDPQDKPEDDGERRETFATGVGRDICSED